MDRTAFEAELQRDGYQVVVNTMQPGAINPEHAHDFDARLLVVAGEMTIVVGGQRNTYQRRRDVQHDARLPPFRTGRPGRRHLRRRPPQARHELEPRKRPMPEPGRALPQPTPETQHFWDGTQGRRTAPAALRRLQQGVFPAAAVLPGLRLARGQRVQGAAARRSSTAT